MFRHHHHSSSFLNGVCVPCQSIEMVVWTNRQETFMTPRPFKRVEIPQSDPQSASASWRNSSATCWRVCGSHLGRALMQSNLWMNLMHPVGSPVEPLHPGVRSDRTGRLVLVIFHRSQDLNAPPVRDSTANGGETTIPKQDANSSLRCSRNDTDRIRSFFRL